VKPAVIAIQLLTPLVVELNTQPLVLGLPNAGSNALEAKNAAVPKVPPGPIFRVNESAEASNVIVLLTCRVLLTVPPANVKPEASALSVKLLKLPAVTFPIKIGLLGIYDMIKSF
jgi:hypothetical protein